MADKPTAVAQRTTNQPARREPLPSSSPFAMLDRFAQEMDRVFDDFGFGRSWMRPGSAPWPGLSQQSGFLWSPQIEVSQRNNELVVHADLPGVKKDDVSIEVTDDAITISGERRQEQESEREGIYRSERSYGTFCRTIPLPEGAMTDQAKATFKDGVLEITIPAPPQATKGRRLEISESQKSEVKSQK